MALAFLREGAEAGDERFTQIMGLTPERGGLGDTNVDLHLRGCRSPRSRLKLLVIESFQSPSSGRVQDQNEPHGPLEETFT